MDLRRRAERHSGTATRMRGEFRQHSDRVVQIARRLLATPLGLSACFGAGAAAGFSTSARASAKAQPDGKKETSRTSKVIADATTRLASAIIVGLLMKAAEDDGDNAPSDNS